MKNNGFSLLELSIVLVIIGLIAGGIVAGASMIRAAELRSIITQQERFKTSMHTFRDKYLGLPGDLKNADSFWPTECIVSPHSSSNTCNGNGNRAIGAWSTEGLRAWQHLALSGLVSGNYTGIGDGASTNLTPDVNTPRAPIGNGGYMLINEASLTYGRTTGNMIWVAAETGTGSLSNGILTPEEAWGIDKKIDDGNADNGKLLTVNGNGYSKTSTDACSDGDKGDTAGSYNLANTTPNCRIQIIID